MKTGEDGCSFTFALTFAEGDGLGTVVAAQGSKKHAKAHWKYHSNDTFVTAEDKPWSSVGLKSFTNATAKAGVLKWLTWIIQHTPVTSEPPDEGDA